MRVLVTGGSGLVGTYVLCALKDEHDVVNLDRVPSKAFPDIQFVQADLMDLPGTLDAVKDCEAVVHLAAIPDSLTEPGDLVLKVNVTTTYNVLEAVRENRIPRIVFGCSESSTGFGICKKHYAPEYLPIDEEHPLWPHESYSLSKCFGERMCEEYSRAYEIESVSLRYGWVWLHSVAEQVERILANRPAVGLGAYVFPEDVALAVRLALEFDMKARNTVFEAFFIMAARTFLSVPTAEGAAALCGKHDIPVEPAGYFDENPYRSAFSIDKARELLGFEPQFAAADFHGERRWRIP